VALVWLGGLIGVVGLAIMGLGVFAPHAVPFIAKL
jgi:hypothetical protein